MFYLYYKIETPALAYPATVLMSAKPAAVAENTSNNLVWAVTGIDNPERRALLIVPIASIPGKGWSQCYSSTCNWRKNIIRCSRAI